MRFHDFQERAILDTVFSAPGLLFCGNSNFFLLRQQDIQLKIGVWKRFGKVDQFFENVGQCFARRAVATTDDFAIATRFLQQLSAGGQWFDDDDLVCLRQVADLVANRQQRCTLHFDKPVIRVDGVDAVVAQVDFVTILVFDIVQLQLIM